MLTTKPVGLTLFCVLFLSIFSSCLAKEQSYNICGFCGFFLVVVVMVVGRCYSPQCDKLLFG